MKAKSHEGFNSIRLEVSIAGVLSLDTRHETEEECIKALLHEVLLIAKQTPNFIDAMLEDTSDEND